MEMELCPAAESVIAAGLIKSTRILMTLTFKDLNLSAETLTALEAKGFITPTPIQAETIPRLLSGCHDIIGQARTGTGKTAAFGLPLIEKIDFENPKVQALVLAPTRELAQQVAVEIQSLSHGKNLKVACVYGGQNIEPQIKAIKNGAQIVVGTPGRVIDHLNRKTIRPEEIKMVVLDEADEMLAMGFIEDLEVILEYVPEDRQMLMFSATMPKRIQRLAEQFMKGYELVKAADLQENTVSLVTQIAHVVSGKQRPAALKRIIDATDKFYGVVFCRTRAEVDEVGARLAEEGNRAEVIHGDVSQPQREKIISNFKRRKTHVLVATDVAARGLDISGLSHVVNYSLPQNPEIYVHRIGRTGRAGNEGTAITLITSREKRRLSDYERATSGRITIEPMPSGEAIIRRHEEKILENVKSIIETEKHKKFTNMAQSLLELGEA
ncbi:MAG: DEAD/DEAH box helicase, partial [Lentisphaeria bacterium]